MPTDPIADAAYVASLNPFDPYRRGAQIFPARTDEPLERAADGGTVEALSKEAVLFERSDVRSGSVQRVASSVSEGSIVVSAIHAILAEQ